MKLALLIPAVLCFLVPAWLVLAYNTLISSRKGVPILIYQKVSGGAADEITIASGKPTIFSFRIKLNKGRRKLFC